MAHASQARPAPRARTLDLDPVFNRLDRDEGLLADLVETYLSEAPGLLRRLHSALASRDAGAVERAATLARGAFLAIGAQAAAAAAAEIQRTARRRDLEPAVAMMAHLRRESAEVETELRTLLAEALD